MEYKFNGLKLLVAGETCIDETVFGTSVRASPEAPIAPVLANPAYSYRIGMAGNVAKNVKALGAEAVLVTVMREDDLGMSILSGMWNAGVRSIPVFDANRPTIKKTRFIVNGEQKLRLDVEEARPLDQDPAAEFADNVWFELHKCDGLIIQDYGKGLWTETALRQVMASAASLGKPVFVDPSRGGTLASYAGASLIKANAGEALILCSAFSDPLQSLLRFCDHAVITCGEKPTLASSKDEKPFQVAALPVVYPDVCGAGDTVIAALAVAMCAGASLREAVEFANAAAAVVVGKPGTATSTLSEALSILQGGGK